MEPTDAAQGPSYSGKFEFGLLVIYDSKRVS
jgi:hypothetical protein